MASISRASSPLGALQRIPLNAVLMPILALLGAWIVWNFVDAPTQFGNIVVIGLTNGALYALVALGYTLVYGIIELINFAHGDLFMLGSVFAGFMINEWFGVTHFTAGALAVFFFALLCTMVFCAAINIFIERFAYRPLRNAPKLAPLITAVGISFVLQNVGIIWNGSTPQSHLPALPSGNISLGGGVTVGWPALATILLTIPLLIALTYIVKKTRTGKAMRATAQDADAARLMGIDVNRVIAFTFALGGAMAGAAGVMTVQVNGQTRYDAGFQLGLIAFTAAVLGGVGNLTGAVLGGVLIGLIQGLNDGAPHGLGQEWSQTVVFSILIALLVFRPWGLLGKPTTEKV